MRLRTRGDTTSVTRSSGQAAAGTPSWLPGAGACAWQQPRPQERQPSYHVLVHLPIHASWLNQIEIYFSILQRKALTPDDFSTFDAAAQRILAFQDHYQQIAQPFEWRFTRRDLARLLRRSAQLEHLPNAA